MNVVIINSSDIFEYRINLIYEILKEVGHQVTIIGSDYMHIEKRYREIDNPDYELIHTLSYKKNISLKRLVSHYKFSRDAYKKIAEKKIDLLYIVVPPNSQALIARKYKQKNTKIIMDIIDLWPESFPISGTDKFPFTLWTNIRNKHLKYADYIITECNLYQEKLKKYININKTATLYWAHKDNDIEIVPKLEKNRIHLCYLGSINNIIDIQEIGRIIKTMIQKTPVVLKIIGDGERRDELIQVAEEAGAQVVFYGKIYNPHEKQKIFDTCHFGLNIMKKQVCVGLSMKSIDYFEAGLPIINNIAGDTEYMVSTYGIGFNTNKIMKIEEKNYSRESSKIKMIYIKYFSYLQFRSRFLNIMRDMELYKNGE